MESLLDELSLRSLSWCRNSTKYKCRPLARSKLELGRDIRGLFLQGDSGVQRQWRTRPARRRKNRIVVFDAQGVPTHHIIKSWLAQHLEIDLTPDHGHGADNLIRLLFVGPDGHVVRQFGHPLFRKEPGEQDVRVGQIQLSYPPLLELRLNVKTAAFLVIEQACENGGGIEIRIAEKVNGTVYRYERNGAHISNDSVVLNCFKAHWWGSAPKVTFGC